MAERSAAQSGSRKRFPWQAPLIALLALLAASALSFPFLVDQLGGDFSGPPREMNANIGPRAQALIAASFQDIAPGKQVDFHTHILGTGAGNTGTFVNEDMSSLWRPEKFIRFSVFKSAAGIADLEAGDAQYLGRLTDLIRHIPQPGTYMLLAFDKHYRRDGTVDLGYTEFFVPNEYVFNLSRKAPGTFQPVISVHPYRKDALRKLEYWAGQGVRFIKWLPNAMGIDPSDEKIDPYYRTMKKLGMILITHTGGERAVEAGDFQRFGNPLLFRRPLDMGVRVVMAHCASTGTNPDLDSPGREEVSNFRLFLRMMGNKRYEGLLFGEISAMTQFNRFRGKLDVLLEREDLHPRLVNGSDYPLPAVNIIIWTGELRKDGYISGEEKEALDRIYRYNPLLFDFVLKRTLRHPTSGRKFPPSVFMSPFEQPQKIRE